MFGREIPQQSDKLLIAEASVQQIVLGGKRGKNRLLGILQRLETRHQPESLQGIDGCRTGAGPSAARVNQSIEIILHDKRIRRIQLCRLKRRQGMFRTARYILRVSFDWTRR